MKVKDLIEKLEQYNQEAEMNVVANNKQHEFTMAFGGADGAEKENCSSVSIWVDDLNMSEAAS